MIKQVALTEIKPYENNPRKNAKAVEVVKDSIERFGFKQPIVLDKDSVIIAGHTRYLAANDLGWAQVPAIYATDLSEEDVRKYRLMDNKSAEFADWDNDLLRQELEQFQELGFDFQGTGFSAKELAEILNKDVDADAYTDKIEAPVYEPSEDKPPLSDLFDDTRTKELQQEIEQSGVSKEKKAFLKAAATRFTEFNFERIADYYSHTDKETQRLFEKLALVIIDFDKAIEQGFVELTQKLRENYPNR